MGSSPWATVPARKPSLVWTLHRLQGNNLHHYSLGTAGEFLLQHLQHILSSLFSDLGVWRVFFSHIFIAPVSQNGCTVFSTLFKHFFTESPPDHLTGSAVPCSRSIGASWDRLCLAKGRTWPLSQWPPLQTPALISWYIKQIQKHPWEHQLKVLNKMYLWRDSSHPIKCYNSIRLGR